MSEVLMLSMNTGGLTRALSSRTAFVTASIIQSKIEGHIVQEVKVLKAVATDLPIPIKLPPTRSPSGARTVRSIKSNLNSPLVSPKSMVGSKTFMFSPKSSQPDSCQRKNKSSKRQQDHSPRQDIGELLKNSLKQEKTQQKAQKIRVKQEIKSKLQKKLQLKVLDEFIRQENLNKFKQKCPLSRPKWGMDDKKVILDTRILRELEKQKKKLKVKKTVPFEVYTPNKKKKTAKKKQLDKSSEGIEDYSDHKKEIFNKIKNLADRVEQLRLGAQGANEKTQGVKKLENALKRWQKRIIFNTLVLHSQSSSSLSRQQEDNEVQSIMNHKKKPSEGEICSESNKSYEKVLENQVKANHKQQQQLIDLKARDMQEMNKLADILGGNPEMKKKFEVMIERRYSKLENLFQENLENFKQVLGVEDLQVEDEKIADDVPLPSLRNTISEFSSSFLIQLNEVPASCMINMTFEDVPVQEEEFVESPSDSLYSRDTHSEPDETVLKFPDVNNPNTLLNSQEEPSIPLISESILIETDMRLMNSADSIEQLVGGIQSKDASEINFSIDNTLDLKSTAIQPQNPMFILEDSYGSGESGSNANFSSIICQPVPENEIKEESHHSESKSGRIIIEKFPSPFTDMYESSTEIEGYELIINRIIFTLEKDIFNLIYEDLKSDDEYWINIPRKPAIAIRMSLQDFENQVQTDSIAVLSAFKKLQLIKDPDEIIDIIRQVYNPYYMLCRVQDRFLELEEEPQIFNYNDIESLEKLSNVSFSSSSSLSSQNPYKAIHNKMVIDAVNEVILRSAKKKIDMPWKLQDQVYSLEFDGLMRVAGKKLMKWAEIEAGKIPNYDLINSFGVLDEDRLQAIRQEKLAQLLIFDVAEADKSWVECDFEETQTVIEVSENLIGLLLAETEELIRLELT